MNIVKIVQALYWPLGFIIGYFYLRFCITTCITKREKKQEKKIETLEKEIAELKEIQKESLIKLAKRESVLKYIIESEKIAIEDKKDDAIDELIKLYNTNSPL